MIEHKRVVLRGTNCPSYLTIDRVYIAKGYDNSSFKWLTDDDDDEVGFLIDPEINSSHFDGYDCHWELVEE